MNRLKEIREDKDLLQSDIAKILNKEPKQIDNTIQRIRNKIKDLI